LVCGYGAAPQPSTEFLSESCPRHPETIYTYHTGNLPQEQKLRAVAANGGLLELSSYVFIDKLTEVLEAPFLREIGPYSPSFAPNGDMLTNAGGGEFTDSGRTCAHMLGPDIRMSQILAAPQ
jgi:hypothetical protein